MSCIRVVFSEAYQTGQYRAGAGQEIEICSDELKRVQAKYGKDFAKEVIVKAKVKAKAKQ